MLGRAPVTRIENHLPLGPALARTFASHAITVDVLKDKKTDTNTPAAYASRNANSTASVYGLDPPPIEKLMPLTPSRMAC